MKRRDPDKLYAEIIIGTFLIGTMAFLVANSWENFLEETIEYSEPPIGGKPYKLIISGVFAVLITFLAIVVAYFLIKFEIVKNVGHVTG